MKIYNQNKTEIIENPDLTKGHLLNDKIISEILPAQEEIKEQGHYSVVKEYDNGGKDVEWVIDVEGQKAREEQIIYEDIQIYIPFTEEQILNNLRARREQECFSYINRGVLWYNTLTTEQQQELNTWYQAWLNVPQVYLETKPTDIETIIPSKPIWLK